MAKLIRDKEIAKFKEALKETILKFIDEFEFHELKNPFRPGDWVKIDREVKDAYQETWHRAGDILQVKYLAKDGEGLMFGSDLGVHWTNAQRVSSPGEVK